MGRSRSINTELTFSRAKRILATDRRWLYFGCCGSLIWFVWMLKPGWEISTSSTIVYNGAQYFAVWMVVYSSLYVLAKWFYTGSEAQGDELTQLPLSETHWFVQRVLDYALIPLAVMLLCLPLFTILCIFHQAPYGESGSRYVIHYGEDDWWAFLKEPWGWRIFFAHLNLLYCGLLPVGIAVVLREMLRTRWLRILVFIAIGSGLYIVSERIRFEFLELAYRKSQPLDRWPFALLLLLVVLVPVLLGCLNRRGKFALIVSVICATALFAVMPWLQYLALGIEETGWLRNTLGDMRFAMALFFGHLSPIENNRLIFDSYVSALLFTEMPLLPKRISVWVFAGIYPLGFALWLLLGTGLGYMLRGKPARGEV